MLRIITVVILLYSSLSPSLHAQLLPLEGSKLNYRIIGISFPAKKGVDQYKVEIAKGTYNEDGAFKQNIITSLTAKQHKIIAEVPEFGRGYTWRVVYCNGRKNIPEHGFHHFSTLLSEEVDLSKARLRVTTPAKKHKDTYVFLDGNKALYDVNGKPVWFLHDVINGKEISKLPVRDLKISPTNNLTFLAEPVGAYEVNFNGKLIWQAPNDGEVSGEQSEMYHHEVTHLPSGHYMVLSTEMQLWNKQMPGADTGYEIQPLSLLKSPIANKKRYYDRCLSATW